MNIKQFQLSSFSLYVIFMMCIVMLIVIWSAHTRISEHTRYHRDASLITTQKTANEVNFYIQEKKRLVRLFAMRNSTKLLHVLQNPEDDIAYNETLEELRTYFPSIFTYSVATSSGRITRDNLQNKMGKKCRDDLKNFIQTGRQNIRVHGYETHHFDIITRFKNKHQKGILFVSFKTNMISNSLLYAEVPGHLLLLTLPSENQLIEITPEGARDVWVRDDYHLNQNEISRILSRSDVNNTEWAVIDLYNQDLFSDYKKTILIQSNLIIFILVISGLLFMILNHHEFNRRRKAEAVKDEFLSIVSHELRTPLTAINGAITLINNGVTGKISPKMQSVLTIANNNTQRLASLVNDLLDVQKIESRQMKYQRKLIKPIVFVENAVIDLQSSYQPELFDIKINNQLKNELVFADSSRMEQVINNIISNAIKYGSANDSINIELRRKGDYVIISVTDYGEGISEDKQDQIFEKFTQTTMTDNRHESGSGLGLYIAKMIIEYHDGDITYTSTPGKDTTFYIKLPIIIVKKSN